MLHKALITAVLIIMPTIANAQDIVRTEVVIGKNKQAATLVHEWVQAYFEGTRSMDAKQWASAFASTAVLDDPVGLPVKDTPEAILTQGEGFVKAFRDIGLFESYVHVVGNEAVAKWTARGVTQDGQTVSFDGINHFTFDEDGKITLLRGFFSPPGQ